ncbi:hypothetical protein DBR06_SOUSAS17110005 [Sousa chinensis]|nr:hypothetical protein DBR06_SOUSAS17110005 [Sousa chinensis]
MKHWNYPATYSHSHRIYRLHPTLRTDIILRCNCYHKPTLSNPMYRHHPSLAAVHLFLHETGSNNPTGIPSNTDKIQFHPYYTVKDILDALLLILALLVLALFSPDLLGNPDNYTPANPLSMPPHIKPE